MRRRVPLLIAVSAAALMALGSGPAASAASPPIQLLLGQGAAFAVLGHSCGGIQEQSFVTGFDPTSGYPLGQVDLSTRCGGSGRGGGYHVTTYTGTASVTWDFTGTVVTSTSPATGPAPDPTFTATDASGNQIYNASGSAFLVLADGYVPAPRLVTVSATVGPSSGGTSVTLTGTGFTGATQVAFGGVPATSFTVSGDTSITAVSPAAPAGTADITVTGPGGTSAAAPSDQFTFVAPPVVTGLNPSSGPVTGGTQVTITGSGFTGATSVLFGGQPAGFTVDSDTSITATSPAGEAIETVGVTVTTVGGTGSSGAAAGFSYLTPTPCWGGCSFTSPATASAATGVPFSFTVSATGGVTPTFRLKGHRPRGVTFVDNLDGTATLSGTPTGTASRPAAGTYTLQVTATFTAGTVKQKVVQTLVLTVS